MSKMNFTELQNRQEQWANKNFPKRQAYQTLLGAVEEIGELAHAHLKFEQGIRGSDIKHLDEAKDAVGDIVIYLADYCTCMGFSMQKIVEDTWTEVEVRDWISNPETGVVDD